MIAIESAFQRPAAESTTINFGKPGQTARSMQIVQSPPPIETARKALSIVHACSINILIELDKQPLTSACGLSIAGCENEKAHC
jgi:hypothetical protein